MEKMQENMCNKHVLTFLEKHNVALFSPFSAHFYPPPPLAVEGLPAYCICASPRTGRVRLDNSTYEAMCLAF